MSVASGQSACGGLIRGRNFGKCQISNPKTQTNHNTQKPKFQTLWRRAGFGIWTIGIWCLFVICHLLFVISLMSQYIKYLDLQKPEAA